MRFLPGAFCRAHFPAITKGASKTRRATDWQSRKSRRTGFDCYERAWAAAFGSLVIAIIILLLLPLSLLLAKAFAVT